MDFTLREVAIFSTVMRILIVCATPGEAVFSGADPGVSTGVAFKLPHPTHTIDVLITGVGMVATTYHLGRRLMQEQYDLAINIGICGAFSRHLVGKTVIINQDCFADFGAEDKEEFLDVFQTGLMMDNDIPFKNGWLHSDAKVNHEILRNLPQVIGITVNKSSGRIETINKLSLKYKAGIESMEGASFIYCCRMNKTPCLQIRSVSNYIEPRNKSAWKIEDALSSLKKVMEELLGVL